MRTCTTPNISTIRRRVHYITGPFIVSLLVLGIFMVPVSSSAADAPSDLAFAQQMLRLCQIELETATTNAQRSRAQNCISDTQRAIDALLATPTPTATTIAPTPTPTMTATPTPAPTATPPPPQQLNCLANPSACGYPDATNTGPSGTLIQVNSNVSINTAGMVYENRAVNGCIDVTAPNVTIRNVSVHCTFAYGIDYEGEGNGTLTIEDSIIDCGGVLANAIGEQRLIVRRVEIRGCEHGFDLDHTADIRDVWCHDMTSNEVWPTGHTDCIMGQMYHDVMIAHNTLDARTITTSAIEGDCGTCGSVVRTGWTVTNNILAGGAYTLYCTNRSTETGSVVSNNRFAPYYAYGYATSCDQGVSWSQNINDVTGTVLEAQ